MEKPTIDLGDHVCPYFKDCSKCPVFYLCPYPIGCESAEEMYIHDKALLELAVEWLKENDYVPS